MGDEKRGSLWEEPKEVFWHGVKYIIGGSIIIVLFPLKQLGFLAVACGVICCFALAPYLLLVGWKNKKNIGKEKKPNLWERYLAWVDRKING